MTFYRVAVKVRVQTAMAAPLGEDDGPISLVQRVLQFSCPMEGYWMCLGVGAADLEAIEINQCGRCEDCFLQFLDWLRKGGRKSEKKLIQAMWDVTEDEEFIIWSGTGLHSAPFSIAIIILVSSILPAIPAVHVYRWLTANPLTSAAHTLKGLYRHHLVVEFELLDFTANMPYINVMMEFAYRKAGNIGRN